MLLRSRSRLARDWVWSLGAAVAEQAVEQLPRVDLLAAGAVGDRQEMLFE